MIIATIYGRMSWSPEQKRSGTQLGESRRHEVDQPSRGLDVTGNGGYKTRTESTKSSQFSSSNNDIRKDK